MFPPEALFLFLFLFIYFCIELFATFHSHVAYISREYIWILLVYFPRIFLPPACEWILKKIKLKKTVNLIWVLFWLASRRNLCQASGEWFAIVVFPLSQSSGCSLSSQEKIIPKVSLICWYFIKQNWNMGRVTKKKHLLLLRVYMGLSGYYPDRRTKLNWIIRSYLREELWPKFISLNKLFQLS